MTTSSPQAAEMAHESMVRTLEAQAQALWPQEAPLFARYAEPATVLDVGCGTGEISARLAELYPGATILGVDLEAQHLERARARCATFGPRVTFQPADALALDLPSDAFDLVVCRHLLQALPDARRALEEMRRVARRRGRLHVLAEDYGMIQAHPLATGTERLWETLILDYARAIGCDVHVGRKMFTWLGELGLTDIMADYLVIDTLRASRSVLARIWEAWRDGYVGPLAKHGNVPVGQVAAYFQNVIDTVRNPSGYLLWQVPIWSALKP
jgi:SAM-dependent methyltransferase